MADQAPDIQQSVSPEKCRFLCRAAVFRLPATDLVPEFPNATYDMTVRRVGCEGSFASYAEKRASHARVIDYPYTIVRLI